MAKAWVLIDSNTPDFAQTGLAKTSVLRADKIATAHQSIFQRQLGELPKDLQQHVQVALREALNLI
jgi:mRNA-degrading endonuclease toxin of MazEF toxin-antitoxin module